MKKFKIFMSMFVCVAMLTIVLTSCQTPAKNVSDNTVDNTVEEKGEAIKIGVSAFPGWFLWYIAEDENFFEKNGVNAELVWFPVYSDSLQAFNAGQIDMVCASVCDTIAPLSQGIDFKAVLINDNSAGGDAIVAKKEYSSVTDLKGKTVATEYGAIDHFFLLKALENFGMTENDINFVNMSIQDAGPALIAGSIDAACLLEPVISMATANGENKVLYSTESTPGLVQDLTIVQTSVLEERPDDIKNIVKTFFDCVEFYNTNRDKAYEDMMDVAGVTKEEMPGVMKGAKIFNLSDNLSAMTNKRESNEWLAFAAKENADYLKSINMTDKTYTADEIQGKMVYTSIIEELAKEAGISGQ